MLHCLVWSARVLDLTVLVSLSNQPRVLYPLKRLKCLMKSDALSEKSAYLSLSLGRLPRWILQGNQVSAIPDLFDAANIT